MNLRPYQKDSIAQLRNEIKKGNRMIILSLPTGAGKTIIFTFMTSEHLKRTPTNKALIITDRIELMYSADGAIKRHDLKPELIKAGAKGIDLDNNCFVGMVETISRRRKQLADFCKTITLVIADEAHKGNFQKLYSLFPNAFIIGATATPVATKNNRLSDIFDSMVVGVQVPELIKGGYLSRPRHYTPITDHKKFNTVAGEYNQQQVFDEFDTKRLYEGLLTCYRKYGEGKTLIFCVNIKHTINTHKAFKDVGYNVEYLTSKDNKEDRKNILNWFSKTDNAILVNCGILTTGYDEPTINTIVLNRKTKSLPLYMQMIGRGSRVTPTKKEFIIIDMGNNLEDHSPWEMVRDWRKFWNYEEKPEGVAPVKMCGNKECECMIPASLEVCPHCDFVFPVKVKESIIISEMEIKTQTEWVRFEDLYTFEELLTAQKRGGKHTFKPYKYGWLLFQCHKKGLLQDLAEYKGTTVSKLKYSLRNFKS